MRLSLNSSTIKTTPLLDKIRVAGEAGYAGIELWAVELYEHVGRGGEISDVEKALADHGLAVPCFIAVRNWGESSGWEYRLAMDEARRRFELAARLGAPLMVCTPPLERPGIEGLHRGYADLLQIGRETGVRAVLEYISFFASLNNIPDTVTVLDECGDPEGCTILDASTTGTIAPPSTTFAPCPSSASPTTTSMTPPPASRADRKKIPTASCPATESLI